MPQATGSPTDVRYVTLTSSTDGTAIVAAAGAGNRIRVLALVAVAGGAVTFTLKSASTKITGDNALAANGGLVLPYSDNGWCQTAANEALNIGLSGAVSVGVTVVYCLVR